MSSEELAQEASKKIKGWIVGKNKLVIAIDGYVGVGIENSISQNSKLISF